MPTMGNFTIKKHSLLALAAQLHNPKAHKTSHQAGGSDELDLSGLTPSLHASRHQNGGADEVSVTGLSGLLADQQTPLIHGTAKHDTTVSKKRASYFPLWNYWAQITNTVYWASNWRTEIDKSLFDKVDAIYFMMSLQAGAGQTISAKVYNVTDGADVSGSELTHNTTTMTSLKSGDIKANIPNSAKVYELYFKVNGGTGAMTNAAILIVQSE